MAYVRTKAQAEAARANGFRIVWCPEDYREEALEALKAEMQPGDWLKLPDVCEENTLRELRTWTEKRNCWAVLYSDRPGSWGWTGRWRTARGPGSR